MTRKKTLTALTVALLGSGLFATAALADRGHGQDMQGDRAPFGQALDFAAIDADKDGKITQAEFDAYRAAQTKAMDADGDGFVSAEELIAQRQKDMIAREQDMAARMITRLDADKDGKLSVAELDAMPRKGNLISRLDTDNDGAVSQAELDAGKQKMADRMQDRMGKHGKHRRHGHDGGDDGQGNN